MRKYMLSLLTMSIDKIRTNENLTWTELHPETSTAWPEVLLVIILLSIISVRTLTAVMACWYE